MAIYHRKDNSYKDITNIYQYINGTYKSLDSIYHYIDGTMKLIWASIRSCFGSGFWVGEKPWLGMESWKNE